MNWYLLVLFSFVPTTYSVDQSDQCRPNGASIYRRFATKTPYAYLVDSLETVNSTSESQCVPVQFWTVVRHGTRYPSAEAVNFILKDLPALRDTILKSALSKLCPEDVEALKNWKPEIEVEQAKDLHPEGEQEMILLAERFQSRFPSLLGEKYHPEAFLFRSTKKQRARLSARNYATGLFSRPVANKVNLTIVSETHDPLIRFYKLCQKWIAEVKKNPESRVEFNKFSQSPWVELVRKNVSDFLGVWVKAESGDEEVKKPLSLSTLEQIYIACIFYQAWHPGKNSPWCAAFGNQELEVMEYREDLDNFHIDGPAYEVTYRQACVLFSDLYFNFLNVTKGVPSEERGIFYFSHAGTVQKLLAFLRLYEGRLTSEGYRPGENWAWRTSSISPFGANIAFLLRKCGTDLPHFEVGLYVNERLVALPGCGEADWCDWATFSQAYGPQASQCDFEKICQTNARPIHQDLEVEDDKF